MSSEETPARCAALTLAGQPCKNKALPGLPFCRVHRSAATSVLHPAADSQAAQPEAGSEQPAGSTEAEPEPADLRRQLVRELDKFISRVRALAAQRESSIPAPRTLSGAIEDKIAQLAPSLGADALQILRDALNSDALDIETWKGLWFVINYVLQLQSAQIKRRLAGEYETDPWGLDREFLEAVQPLFEFLYKTYWRVQTTGIENVPASGRGLITANHSGQLPWDGAMVATAVRLEHPGQRLVRTLYASWFPTLPFLSATFAKLGHALATVDNGMRLLEQDELVAVYPEGYKGVGKLYRDRYKLARFGRGGFIRMALRTAAPIIPVSVVGAEETYISLAKSSTMARLTGFPYFPISPTFPWLGLLGFVPLPTKWYIDFGPPIPTESYGAGAADNLVLVSELTDQVRNIIQGMINSRLAQRRSVFLG